eukprot:12056351-Heterocapsa_arctica.AAC.1
MRKPCDFKYAFLSAEEAGCAAGPLAAEAWTAMRYLDVQVPSAWKLWIQNRGCLQGKPSEAKLPSMK